MSSPPTHYARSGDASIAYQVVQTAPAGACDLVLINGPASHLELIWEEPRTARTLRTMAQFARLIMFDRRGTGLSDPVSEPPTLEQQVDDLRAVLAAVGSERVSLIGGSDLGLSALFAASYPEQVSALVLCGVAADGAHTLVGRGHQQMLEAIENSWGDGTLVSVFAPSQAGNPDFVEWWGRMQRSAVSPGMARKLMDMTRPDQPACHPADDQRAHARRALHRRSGGAGGVRPGGGRPHPRCALRRVRGRGRLHVVRCAGAARR